MYKNCIENDASQEAKGSEVKRKEREYPDFVATESEDFKATSGIASRASTAGSLGSVQSGAARIATNSEKVGLQKESQNDKSASRQLPFPDHFPLNLVRA